MRYPVRTQAWMRWLYPSCVWEMPTTEKNIYLSFDDGPHPEVTPFVLDLLKRYEAKATFFCIGKNVQAYPAVYQRILAEGHAVGNHTQHHMNGWKTDCARYCEDVQLAAQQIDSKLFRPPYGKISRSQLQVLKNEYQIVMWSVLSGDFDTNISAEQVWANVKQYTKSGSVVVMHDSEKAFPRMGVVLPVCLDYFSNLGYAFKKFGPG